MFMVLCDKTSPDQLTTDGQPTTDQSMTTTKVQLREQ